MSSVLFSKYLSKEENDGKINSNSHGGIPGSSWCGSAAIRTACGCVGGTAVSDISEHSGTKPTGEAARDRNISEGSGRGGEEECRS